MISENDKQTILLEVEVGISTYVSIKALELNEMQTRDLLLDMAEAFDMATSETKREKVIEILENCIGEPKPW